jgi:hypothetical protein
MYLGNVPLSRLKQQIGTSIRNPLLETQIRGQNDILQAFELALGQDLRAFFRRKIS